MNGTPLPADDPVGRPGEDALLVIPLVLAAIALRTGSSFAKLGVPLSCALTLLWVHRGALGRHRRLFWVVAAFAFSAAGDWFLSHRRGREGYFLMGIGLFACAHGGYLGYAGSQGRPSLRALAVLLGVYLPYYAVWLRPEIRSPALSAAVLGYLLISCVVLSAACGMRLERGPYWAYVAGMALVVFSDTIISFSEFLGFRDWNGLILPTYYLAHGCVTWSVLHSGLARRRESCSNHPL
ncbi:MAG TPA: lysoplasmalogenase family protein [Verrucomicrobiota bacterium]|nr:lysoplasmalogenase family protein [Verrucomicrobiota bacterium]HNU52926.1 lysoplasmalogenase family protein [Verrucomicrobiota bacterium]